MKESVWMKKRVCVDGKRVRLRECVDEKKKERECVWMKKRERVCG